MIYMTTENNLIQPAVVGKSVDLTPPTTMIAAFAGAAVAGVPGALVATPLVGAMKQIYLEREEGQGRPRVRTGFPGPPAQRDQAQEALNRAVATLRRPHAQIAQSVEQRTRNA